MSKSFDWSGFFRQHLFWIVLGVAIVGWLLASQGVQDFFRRRRELKKLTEHYHEVQNRVWEKQRQLLRSKNDDGFLELEARRHLGLVRPDEIEFRFISDSDPEKSLEKMNKTHPADDLPQQKHD